jgi:branched-chain amino acid transport system permease protein
MNPSRSALNLRLIGCAVVALVALALGFAMPEFATFQATNWALFGLLAVSLTLVWGHGGIFSFGQGAFFGIGAYAYSVAAMNILPVTNETVSSVVVAALAAAALYA